MKDYGLLQVYTGSGKGKTTAALGVALRAAGRGAKTVMLSFLKDDPDYGEAMAAQYLPHFLLRQVGRDAFVNFHNPDPIDLKMVREGWEEAKKILIEDTADLLILDELNIVLAAICCHSSIKLRLRPMPFSICGNPSYHDASGSCFSAKILG